MSRRIASFQRDFTVVIAKQDSSKRSYWASAVSGRFARWDTSQWSGI
jgi:hypothetical protein